MGVYSQKKVQETRFLPPLPPFPPLHLEVGSLNSARRSGGTLLAPPAGSGAKPKLNLVHFSLKIWHLDDLVETILIIFMRINWLNLTKIVPIIQRIPCALVQKCNSHIVQSGSPAFHGDALEDGQHGVDDVVEADDAVLRSFPALQTRRLIATVIAASEAARLLGARMFVLVFTEVQLICALISFSVTVKHRRPAKLTTEK